MQYRQLGNTDLNVAPIAFGGNVLGWTIDEKTSFELLDRFTNVGFNFIDTADVYSRWKQGNKGGESETIIGNWMKKNDNRKNIIIATKVGADMGLGDRRLSKKYILQAVENSLTRLQTDYIDLYQTHFDDALTPIAETLEAYDQLIKEGKIRWIGASNLTAERLKESLEISETLGLPKYQSFQPQYNLMERAIYEKEIEPICLQNKLGVINYYALASGFLTGKYRTEEDLNKSSRGAGVKKYLTNRGTKVLEALDTFAIKYNTSAAGIALAWLIARPSITAPIASATNTHQLKAFIDAVKINLTKTEIDILNEASN